MMPTRKRFDFFAAFWVLVVGLVSYAECDDVVLKPIKTGKEEVGMIFIQGAQIQPEQYIPLGNAIQNASQYSLWIGIPDFAFDIPEPIVISGGIKRVLKSMRESGMNSSKIVFMAHSLGGVMLQDFLKKNPTMGIGQILIGSFLLRKYRNVTYPVPTLTIGGELDGLARVTRIMEEYYHRIIHASSMEVAVKNFPVTVISGMSHFQVASGNPPAFVKAFDLKPEISFDDAHRVIAHLSTAFVSIHLGNVSTMSVLTEAVQGSGVFLQPIVKAYELEGFYNFNPPCYDNPPSAACTLGCSWTEHAMQIMGGLTQSRLSDRDAFHPVSQEHFPHILDNCTSPGPTCTIDTTTVTENTYDEMDKLDTGFVYTSAHEIRAKLKSRQAVLEAAGYHNVSFNTSDGFSICKVINQASYDFALQNAGSHTQARFQQFGVPMVMGKDKGPYYAGPLWILTPLSYSKTKSSTGEDMLEVRSAMLQTATDFFIKALAGMHYCKLLSPARATEWIYVDGLREHYSI